MTEARSKLFVLDTNVILHDSGCLRKFAEHDVAVPITVLEELDQFKRGNEDIHFPVSYTHLTLPTIYSV